MTNATAVATTSIPSKHPPGLWVLFITEMWERFSYYGMRALLVLYLIQSTAPVLVDGKENKNPGFGWSKAAAADLSAWYTAAVYVTPLIGGWLADRYLGTHRSLLIGGVIIALGHITLAFTEFFGVTPGQAVTLQTGPGAVICFMSGLALIIIGTGFFKPCVSVMVGQLYERNDPRKDSGFTIFYMGINLGAFFSPLVAGYLGERWGWHWGFGSAAVGMIAGLVFYKIFRPRYLHDIGLQPAAKIAEAQGSTAATPTGMTRVDWDRVIVIGVLALLGNIFFWAAFEQASTSLNFFAVEKTDRTLGGLWGGDGFPASWYQSVNPFVILLFGPVFAWLWVWLERRQRDPSTPMKFVWGLYLLGLAFLAMVAGALKAQGGERVGAQWLLLTYLGATWGELCLSPVGLSMVTRLAPPNLQSLMMGLWFLSMAASNFVAGKLAVVSTHLDTSQHSIVFAPSGNSADIWYEAKPQQLKLLLEGDAATFGDRIRFAGEAHVGGPDQPAELELVSSAARGDDPPIPGLFIADVSQLPVKVTDIEQLDGTLRMDGANGEQQSELKHDHYTFILPGLPGFYLALVLFPIGAGVVLMLLTPMLKRMMHGVH